MSTCRAIPIAVVGDGGAQTDSKPRTLEDLTTEERFASQIELVREHWAAVRRLWLGDSDLDPSGHIRSQLPPEFWLGCGMPGLANIRPTPDGRFEFAEDGQPAIIVPCYDGLPFILDANPERHVEQLVDLIATETDKPSRVWLRRGEALILGSAYLDLAAEVASPLPVFSDPLAWLRAGGAGVVVLDWAWAPDLLLGFELVAENLELGERLASAMKPDVWIMESAA